MNPPSRRARVGTLIAACLAIMVAQIANGPEITTSRILETIASGEHQ